MSDTPRMDKLMRKHDALPKWRWFKRARLRSDAGLIGYCEMWEAWTRRVAQVEIQREKQS
jgi:hypothetical protein